tara:strand:+ start:2460 stop:2741 length:282 start_codon:yes stop_codon:yes gene_type:complete
MNEIQLDYYDNQCHGYTKISKYDIEGLKINKDKILSSYSYFNFDDGCYYLEEDCDGLALQRILENKGYKITYETVNVEPEFFDMNDNFKRLSI